MHTVLTSSSPTPRETPFPTFVPTTKEAFLSLTLEDPLTITLVAIICIALQVTTYENVNTTLELKGRDYSTENRALQVSSH